MTQLAADQQLTLQAFQAAVDTYNQRHIALPAKIADIAAALEPHIDRLDALSESDSAFEMVYQGARSALQSQSSHRAKFLGPNELPIARPTASPASNGHHATANDLPPPRNGRAKPSPPLPIKRFVLALGFTESERQYFDRYIQELKQLNPQWHVSPDQCRAGEAEAYVMIYNNEDYTVNYAAHLVDQFLSQAFK
jgi:hypothetical protein